MLCKSSCLKQETWLSTRLFNSARFMKVLKGTAGKSQISRKLMQSDNRPALLQPVIKRARTEDVVMHSTRNSAQRLAKSVLCAWNASNTSFRHSLQVNRNVSIVGHDEADMLQEDANIHVIIQTQTWNEIHCMASQLTKSGKMDKLLTVQIYHTGIGNLVDIGLEWKLALTPSQPWQLYQGEEEEGGGEVGGTGACP